MYIVGQERVGKSVCKINVPGSARCIACRTDFSYDKRGLTALSDHLKSNKCKKSLDKNTTKNILKLGYFCLLNNLLFLSQVPPDCVDFNLLTAQ